MSDNLSETTSRLINTFARGFWDKHKMPGFDMLVEACAGHPKQFERQFWDMIRERVSLYDNKVFIYYKKPSVWGSEVYQRLEFCKEEFLEFTTGILSTYTVYVRAEGIDIKKVPVHAKLIKLAEWIWGTRAQVNQMKLQPNYLMVFQNGTFDIRTGSFIPDALAPLKFTHPIHAFYVEELESPIFNDFLLRNFPADPASITLINRAIGYNFIPTNFLQKFLWMYGAAGSGKGCLAEIMCGLVGDQNYSDLLWDDFNDKFSVAKTRDKLIVRVDEWSECNKSQLSKRISIVKKYTGGGRAKFQQKYERESDCVLTAKHLFIANTNLPYDSSESKAITRRMVPIYFRNPLKDNERLPEYHLEVLKGEANIIASNAAREFSKAWLQVGGGSIFEVEGSVALIEGKEIFAEANDVLTTVLESGLIVKNPEGFIQSYSLIELIKLVAKALNKGEIQLIDRALAAELRIRFRVSKSKTKRINGHIKRGYEGISLDKERLLELYPDVVEVISNNSHMYAELASILDIEYVSQPNGVDYNHAVTLEDLSKHL